MQAGVRSPSLSDSSSFSVFLFYNPTSGGNTAAVLSSPNLAHAHLHYGLQTVELRLFDIRNGQKGKKPGFLQLKETLQSSEDSSSIRVIVGGGDGTVVWCISELKQHGIDPSKLVIGVIPFGTGNDFARALFWEIRFLHGTDPRSELRQLVYQWINADIVSHDLWTVNIDLHEMGTFKKIDSKTRHKQVVTHENEKGQQVPVRTSSYIMCNYFSVGVESRIGVGFDRYRTTSRFWNKLRYAAEGLKKSMFKHTMKINEIVSSMLVAHGDDWHEIFHCIPSGLNYYCVDDETQSWHLPSISSIDTPRQSPSNSDRVQSLEAMCQTSEDGGVQHLGHLGHQGHYLGQSSGFHHYDGRRDSKKEVDSEQGRPTRSKEDLYVHLQFSGSLEGQETLDTIPKHNSKIDEKQIDDIKIGGKQIDETRFCDNGNFDDDIWSDSMDASDQEITNQEIAGQPSARQETSNQQTGNSSFGRTLDSLRSPKSGSENSDGFDPRFQAAGLLSPTKTPQTTTGTSSQTTTNRRQRPSLQNYLSLGNVNVRAMKMDDGWESTNPTKQSPKLLSAASLIAINIPSFAAGLDIWNNAHRLGVQLDTTNVPEPYKNLLESHQTMGDGRLEFLTFSSAASMGIERMAGCHGRGKRICQGFGPFCFRFFELPRDWRVYYQVDGEFYVMTSPKQVTIAKDCTIRVITNPASPYKKNYRS